MKRVNRILLLSLLVPALASCGEELVYGDYEYLNEIQHVKYCKNCEEDDENYKIVSNHRFDKGYLQVSPTHSSEGLKIYECIDCGYQKDETVSPLTDHVYNRKITTEEYLASEATCAEQAKYYFSCECGAKGTNTFPIGPTLNHKITSITVGKDDTRKQYSSYEKFDSTGLKVLYNCSECGLHEINNDEIVFEYQSGKPSFRVGDTKVIGHYQDKSFELTGFNVTKASNMIYGLEDLTISCHDSLGLENIYSDYGELTFTLKDKNDKVVLANEYSSLEESGSPYTLEANVEAGEEYVSYHAAVQIEVSHDIGYIQSLKSTACLCGVKLLSGYYYNATTNEIVLDHIEGLYKDKFSSANTVVLASTGKEAKWSEIKTGIAQEFITTIDGETVHFAGIKVDKIFTTIEEIKANCLVTEAHSASNPLGNPYCVVANDIDCNGYVYDGGFFRWEGAVYNGNGYCFRGTFDGQNHTISNLKLGGKGIFGYLGTNGVCKDINFKDVSPIDTDTPCAISYYSYYCKFGNISMSFKDYPTLVDGSNLAMCGNIVAFRCEGARSSGTITRFENITIDAAGLNIGALTSSFGNNSETPSFINYNVICKSYSRIGMAYSEIPEGITVYTL